jgi:hypothetical protein
MLRFKVKKKTLGLPVHLATLFVSYFIILEEIEILKQNSRRISDESLLKMLLFLWLYE